MTKPILILLILLPSLYGGTAPLELQKHVIFVKASIGDSGPVDMARDSGSGFLRQFKVIFDLPHDWMVFERP